MLFILNYKLAIFITDSQIDFVYLTFDKLSGFPLIFFPVCLKACVSVELGLVLKCSHCFTVHKYSYSFRLK